MTDRAYIEGRLVMDSKQDLVDEIGRLQVILREINALCHVPTPGHMKAVVHFQRDFDRIRSLTSR